MSDLVYPYSFVPVSGNYSPVPVGEFVPQWDIFKEHQLSFCFVSFLLNVPVNNFQSCPDGATASWVLPVFLGGKCILLKDTTRRPV